MIRSTEVRGRNIRIYKMDIPLTGMSGVWLFSVEDFQTKNKTYDDEFKKIGSRGSFIVKSLFGVPGIVFIEVFSRFYLKITKVEGYYLWEEMEEKINQILNKGNRRKLF